MFIFLFHSTQKLFSIIPEGLYITPKIAFAHNGSDAYIKDNGEKGRRGENLAHAGASGRAGHCGGVGGGPADQDRGEDEHVHAREHPRDRLVLHPFY